MAIDGETVEKVSDFIFWAPKSLQMVTASNWMTVLFLSVNEAKYIKSRFFLRKHMRTALELNPTVS